MAFPAVQTRSTATANASSITVTLPASHADGDLIVILLKSNSGATSWTQTSGTTGWTELADQNGLSIRWKEIGASEADPSFDLSPVSARSGASAVRITGHGDTTIQAPERSVEANGVSIGPNPSALSPTGGAKDYLWLAMCGAEDGRSSVSVAPSSYTGLNAFATPGAGAGAAGATAERQNNTASENPNAFTIDRSAQWYAYTVAIHPVVAALPVARGLTNSPLLGGKIRRMVG